MAKRICKKCDYLVEEVVKVDGGDDEIKVVTSSVFADSTEAEKYIREFADRLTGMTLRIVRVCKVVVVKPIDTPKFKLEDVR